MENIAKEILLQEIMAFYEQYLYAKDIMNAYLDASAAENHQDKSRNFFMMTASACIDSYMMTMARLYDKDKKSKSIYSLLKQCKNNLHLFKDSIDIRDYLIEFNRCLKKDDSLKNAIKIISYRRNKIFAHNDNESFLIDGFEKILNAETNYMPMHQLWKLIKVTGEFLRTISLALNCDLDKSMNSKYDGDLIDLIDENNLHRILPGLL